jgi:ribonucleoside-diphosphate reductase alpha chain
MFSTNPERSGSVAAEVRVASEAERTWVLDAVADALPDVEVRELPPSRDPGAARRIRLEGAALAGFVQKWGLRRTGNDARVPGALYAAPAPVVAAYLRSLFQAEGWVASSGAAVGLAMASPHLVRGVQTLLIRLGLFSRVRRVAEPRAGGNDFWVLNVSKATDGRRFADEIGFVDPSRARELDAALATVKEAGGRATRLVEVDSIEVLGQMDVYDIQTESGEYLSGNLRVHNCFILAVEDTMRSILNWYAEEGIIFKGGSGSGINLSTLRSSHEPLKGGGSASGPVSFMRGADASAGTIKSEIGRAHV